MSQVRMTIWLDKAEHERFQRLFPNHGAFTRICRTLLVRHMDRIEKQGFALIEDQPATSKPQINQE